MVDNDGFNSIYTYASLPRVFFVFQLLMLRVLNEMENNKGNFTKKELPSDNKTGWFQTIKAIDYDHDGDLDLIIG